MFSLHYISEKKQTLLYPTCLTALVLVPLRFLYNENMLILHAEIVFILGLRKLY